MAIGYTYILQCDDSCYYYGSTNDLVQRLQRHRNGLVKSTKWRLPVRLVWYEEHKTLDQARQREYSFKNGRTRRKAIELLIATFPSEKLISFA